jgi:hypothetical protein
MSEGITLFFGMGRDGQPVERTRTEYPYSFDDYVSYTNLEQTLANDSAYTECVDGTTGNTKRCCASISIRTSTTGMAASAEGRGFSA